MRIILDNGEEQNGDNLIAIYDTDIATVFAIEAIELVDHFNFRNTFGTDDHPANANTINNGNKSGNVENTASVTTTGTKTNNTNKVKPNKGIIHPNKVMVVKSKSVSQPKKEITANKRKTVSHKQTSDNKSSDVVTQFPLPAKATDTLKPMTLAGDSNWTNSYFSETDTHCQERALLA